jgi:hypothetical protein
MLNIYLRLAIGGFLFKNSAPKVSPELSYGHPGCAFLNTLTNPGCPGNGRKHYFCAVTRKLLHSFLMLLFIGSIGMTSVNYLWCSNSSVQLIEEEIGTHDNPVSKKSFTLDEEHLSKWLSEFIACQRRFDHGVEILVADHQLYDYSASLSVESPPPDLG